MQSGHMQNRMRSGASPFTAVAVSGFLVDPGVGHVGDFGDKRQIVATEAVGRFPLVASYALQVLVWRDPGPARRS